MVWTGIAAVGGGLSTFHFDDGTGTSAQCVAAVAAFLAATEDRRSGGLSWSTLADVPIFNEQTGDLQAIDTVAVSSGVGTAGGDINPVATQGLLRLLTTAVVNGRLLRGRLFLPGTVEADNTLGAPTAAFLADYNAAGAALIADANTDWGVWSLTHGEIQPVVTASTWNRWAILTSRRD